MTVWHPCLTAWHVLACRFVRPGDKVLLVSCSYEHSNPDADVFKEYEEISAALKVGSQALF
jgi:hypothetical protein